jgi:hypothetical protein
MKANPTEPLNTDAVQVDPFDVSNLTLGQNFADASGVKKLLLTIPVRKPNKQDFVRVHPSVDCRLETAVLVFKEERENFLVARELWSELPGELTPMVLFLATNRQKVPFLWGIRLPGEDGRHDEWNASALEAAALAQRDWVRVVANMSLGAYEVFSASGSIPEPEWPSQSFQEILKIAFKGRFIDHLEHPAIRRLRGEY